MKKIVTVFTWFGCLALVALSAKKMLCSFRASRMPVASTNLLVPIRTSSANGFFASDLQGSRNLFGYELRFLGKYPYTYIEFRGIDYDSAQQMFPNFRSVLAWASVRLDIGVLIEEAPGVDEIVVEDSDYFQCLGPTLYPGTITSPIRLGANQRTEEASGRLFSALAEGSGLSKIQAGLDQKLKVALDLFASVDFEVSTNARFLTLVTILEILSSPSSRRPECVAILEGAMAEMKRQAESTEDTILKEALMNMRQSAGNWKKESITSSVRELARRVAIVLGDPDPVAKAKRAGELYGKRSEITHNGASASVSEVSEVRQLVREAIAVALDKPDHIRTRYPTS